VLGCDGVGWGGWGGVRWGRGGGVGTECPLADSLIGRNMERVRQTNNGCQIGGVHLHSPAEFSHRLHRCAQAEVDAARLRPGVPPLGVHVRGLGIRLREESIDLCLCTSGWV
jgi:hypothetical protein